MLSTLKKNVAIATVALGVMGGGAYALAQTTPARPSLDNVSNAAVATLADTTPGATSTATPRARRALLRRSVHAELVVKAKDGSFQTIDIDKGTLSNVNGDVLKVDRPDGKQVTVKVDSATRYRGISGAGALRTGDKIVVVSKGGTAVVVGQRPAGSTAPSGAQSGAQS
ncbi:MAG TPA: hypothetical protein VHN98_03550 [Acidimicrobiales bacterium]|nr:hypothetical protein [Acidimicrobiales bacterium]